VTKKQTHRDVFETVGDWTEWRLVVFKQNLAARWTRHQKIQIEQRLFWIQLWLLSKRHCPWRSTTALYYKHN